MFDGQNCCPLTRQEEKWREQILNWTQPKACQQRVIDNLDPILPVLTRVSFIEAVAAMCVLHSKEVDRKVTGTPKPVRDVSPQRLEWLLFNNQRVRHALSPLQRALLPSSTTSDEALHSEINSWTRSTHEVHRATLLVTPLPDKLLTMFYWLPDWARTPGVALNGKLQPHWKLGCKLSMPRHVLSQFLIIWVFALVPRTKQTYLYILSGWKM